MTAKKWTKKRDARAKLMFWLIKLLLLWRSRCRHRRRILRSPILYWRQFKWILSWQHWIKVCGPLRKPTSSYFQGFSWSKNNLMKFTYLKSQTLSHYYHLLVKTTLDNSIIDSRSKRTWIDQMAILYLNREERYQRTSNLIDLNPIPNQLEQKRKIW